MINPKIFKAYDVRGIYPDDLDEKMAFLIAQAVVSYAGAKKVIVGRDMRTSSEKLFAALVDGIINTGTDVIDIGLVPTEGVYFALENCDADLAIMITASHNPKEYNGFKAMRRREGSSEFVRGKIIDEYIKEEVRTDNKGNVEKLDIWDKYINHCLSFVDISKIKPLKIVVDAGNGLAGKVIPKVADKLPVEIIPINFKLDGNFPAHPSNPLLDGVSDQVAVKIKEVGADLGFIFDGDMDRIFPVDDTGNLVRGDKTLLMLAQYMLAKYPGKGVAYNLICSKATPEFISRWGGRPIRREVGFVNVRQGMIDEDGIMGGELSGHFCFRDNWYNDSGLIAFLMILELMSSKDQKMSEIAALLTPYFKSPELNFTVSDKEAIIEVFKNKYADGNQDELDGLTVQYPDWWFNIRPSNTEPLLRLTIEADRKELLDGKVSELTNFLEKNN